MTFFLKYIPGNLYINTVIANASEVLAYAASGYLMNIMGIKISYFTGFTVATAGGLLLIFFFGVTSVMPVFVLLAKFGVSFAFNISYCIPPSVFCQCKKSSVSYLPLLYDCPVTPISA